MSGSGKFYSWLLTGVLTVLLAGFVNLILDEVKIQADLTDDNRYTLPPEARKIASSLDDICNVTVYISNPLPSYVEHIPGILRTRLEEFRSASGNHLQFSFVNPDGLAEGEREGINQKGVVPRQLQEFQAGKRVLGSYYLWMAFQYGPKEDLFDLATLGADLISPLEFQKALPFQVCARLVKLLNPDAKVGIVAEKRTPHPQLQSPQEQGGFGKDPHDNLSIVRQRIQSHLEKPVDVNIQQGSVPENVNTVVVFRPSDLSERAVFELDQALMRGQNVVLLLDGMATSDVDRIIDDYVASLRQRPQKPIRVRPLQSGLDDWLGHFGVSVGSGYLESKESPSVMQPLPAVEMGPGGIPRQVFRQATMRYPGFVIARAVDDDRKPTGEVSRDNPIFGGLGGVGMAFPVPLDFDEGTLASRHPGAGGEVVARSSPDTWRRDLEANFLALHVDAQEEKIPPDRRSYPLVLALHGSFRSYFAGKSYGEGEGASDRPPRTDAGGNPIPAPPNEPARLDESIKPGQLWIFADSDFAADLSYHGQIGLVVATQSPAASQTMQAMMSGLINAIDNMTVGPELIAIRKPNLADRSLDRTRMEEDDKSILFRTAVLGPMIVIGLGILMFIFRKLTTGARVAPAVQTRKALVMTSEERA